MKGINIEILKREDEIIGFTFSSKKEKVILDLKTNIIKYAHNTEQILLKNNLGEVLFSINIPEKNSLDIYLFFTDLKEELIMGDNFKNDDEVFRCAFIKKNRPAGRRKKILLGKMSKGLVEKDKRVRVSYFLLDNFVGRNLTEISLTEINSKRKIPYKQISKMNIAIIELFSNTYEKKKEIYDAYFEARDIGPRTLHNWLYGESSPYMDIKNFTPTTRENKHKIH